MKYSLSAHGSGSKLSSLAEQVERERPREGERQRKGSRRGNKNNPPNKGVPLSSVEKQEKRVFLDQLITTSQLLQSDDEEEEETNFPLSLSLQSSQSDTDEQEMVGVVKGEGGGESAEVATPKFPERSVHRRSHSARARGERGEPCDQRQSEQLMENFQQIRSRAASLCSHQSWLEGCGDSAHFRPSAAAVNEYHFEVSQEIKPVNPTFQLPPQTTSSSSEGAPSLGPQSANPGEPDVENYVGGSVNDVADSTRWISGEGVRVVESEGVRVCLAALRQALALTGELVGMAQARQGPIMLLSSSELVRHTHSHTHKHTHTHTHTHTAAEFVGRCFEVSEVL